MTDNSQDVTLETENSSNKRKREVEDVGDQEQKKVHVEDRRLGIEDLHVDVGKKYLLCRTRKAPTSLAYYSLLQRLCSLQYHDYVFCASFTVVFG